MRTGAAFEVDAGPELRGEDGPVPLRLIALHASSDALFAWREVAQRPLESDDDDQDHDE